MKHQLLEKNQFAGKATVLAFPGLVLSCSTGCGALTAVTKPSMLMAPKDEAPLTVVVQRADAASVTAKQVDRLLTATPTGDDSGWPKQSKLSRERIGGLQKQMAESPYYDGTSFSISPTIVWADELTSIHGDAATSPSPLAAISVELGDGYASLQAKIGDVASLEGRFKAEEQLDQLLIETTARTEHFAVEAVALLATASATEATRLAANRLVGRESGNDLNISEVAISHQQTLGGLKCGCVVDRRGDRS